MKFRTQTSVGGDVIWRRDRTFGRERGAARGGIPSISAFMPAATLLPHGCALLRMSTTPTTATFRTYLPLGVGWHILPLRIPVPGRLPQHLPFSGGMVDVLLSRHETIPPPLLHPPPALDVTCAAAATWHGTYAFSHASAPYTATSSPNLPHTPILWRTTCMPRRSKKTHMPRASTCLDKFAACRFQATMSETQPPHHTGKTPLFFDMLLPPPPFFPTADVPALAHMDMAQYPSLLRMRDMLRFRSCMAYTSGGTTHTVQW